MIEPIAFSTMFDKPPFLFPGVVLAVSNVEERHLVALRHDFAQRNTGRKSRSGRKAGIVSDDGNVIVRMHADDARRLGVVGNTAIHLSARIGCVAAHPA